MEPNGNIWWLHLFLKLHILRTTSLGHIIRQGRTFREPTKVVAPQFGLVPLQKMALPEATVALMPQLTVPLSPQSVSFVYIFKTNTVSLLGAGLSMDQIVNGIFYFVSQQIVYIIKCKILLIQLFLSMDQNLVLFVGLPALAFGLCAIKKCVHVTERVAAPALKPQKSSICPRTIEMSLWSSG
jgi:hypothetical protein